MTVLDINGDMLAVGRDRAAKRARPAKSSASSQGNAEDLPFADRHFDAYSIAFGIRNVPRIERALAEAYRVLKIGGHFLCLEFSDVDLPLIGNLYEAYSFTAIPALGKIVTGDGAPYRYLGRVDPQVSRRRNVPRHDRRRRFSARRRDPLCRRHRRHPFRLEIVRRG